MEWELYDKNFNKTNLVIKNDGSENIPDGYYHLTTNAWLINPQKQVLLIKKALNYNLRYPGSWTTINENVEKNESSLNTVIKSLKSKINIEMEEDRIIDIGMEKRDPHHYIYNTFIIYAIIENEKIKLDDRYFTKYKWVDYDELKNMIDNGEIEYALISRIEKYILPILK